MEATRKRHRATQVGPVVRSSPSVDAAVARISRDELRRRIWHMAPGLLPLLLWVIPHEDPISPTLRVILILIIIGLAGNIYRKYRWIERAGETDGLAGVVGYSGCVLLTLLIFSGQAEIGMGVLAILAFGDGSATFAGLLCRGPRLPWNRRKTWAGTLAFILMGGSMATVIYWGESQPTVSFSIAVTCGMTAAVCAAIAESLPVRLNDNIRVGVVSAASLACMHGLYVGWV